MGAATFSKTLGAFGAFDRGESFEDVYRQYRVSKGMLTLSASYATGGDTFVPALAGLREIRRMIIDPSVGLYSNGLSIDMVSTDPAAPKFVAYETLNTEVANATNLTTRPFPVWLLGY